MASVPGDTEARRSHSGYSRVAIALHWTIALLIVGNAVGAKISDAVDKETAGAIMSMHKSIGLTILTLSLVRLAWRIGHGFPRFPESTPKWDAALARATHVALYVLMIAVPLAGWTFVSGGDRPLTWFGLFDWPKLPVGKSTAEFAHEAHELLAFTTVGLALFHAAGALKHHFFDKDDVLARMLPLVRAKVSGRG